VLITEQPSGSQLNPPAEPQWTDRKFIRDVLFANLPAPFLRLRSYAWLVVFSRTTGLAGVGAWALFDTTLSLATTIGTLLLGHAMMRFSSGERDQREASTALASVLVAVTVACSVVGLLIAIFGTSLSRAFFHGSEGRQLAMVIAVVLVFDGVFEEIKGFHRARRANRDVARLVLARTIPEGLLTVAAAVAFHKIAAVAWTYCVCAMIAAALALAHLFRSGAVRLVMPSLAMLRHYLGYSAPLLPGVIVTVGTMRADRYILAHFCTLETVGIYTICVAIAAVNTVVLSPISDVLFPELADLYDRGDREAFNARFGGVQKFAFGITGVVALICIVFPAEAIRLATSVRHPTDLFTLRLLGLQGICVALSFLYGLILSIRLQVWGKTSIAIVAGLLLVGLDVILVPRFGMAGAALAQLLAAGLALSLTLAPTWDIFRQSFQLWWLPRVAAAIIVIALLATASASNELTFLSAGLRIMMGCGGYLTVLVLTGYVGYADLKNVWEAFAR
jgi:O-antigen/teichoic acid export membrane protein